MDRKELEKTEAKVGNHGVFLWDALGVDNNLMMKELVSRSLAPSGDTNSWKVGGVGISAKLVSSAANKLVYRYVFTGPTWRCDFDAVYRDNLKLDMSKSRVLWTMDQNVRPRAAGTCRVELRDWLINALGDNEVV